MKKILNFLFSRVVIVVLILFLQIGFFVIQLWKFQQYSTYITEVLLIISLFVVLWIINKWDNPSYKLVWTMLILTVPVFGGVLYLCFGNTKISNKMRKKIQLINSISEPMLQQDQALIKELEEEDRAVANQVKYIESKATFPIYKNTVTEYFPVGELFYKRFLEELEKAEHFIFMEYYIITEGKMWNGILELLERKVKQGVKVRFMYDDFGCVTFLKPDYFLELEKKGIESVAFNPLIPVLSVLMNHRDHRKITVIDGHTAFTGGINLADEYINELERFGHWKDSAIFIRGEAVWNFTIMFLQMWNIARPTTEDFEQYRPHKHYKGTFHSDGYVQPYGDTPLDHEIVGENVYLNMINKAKRYVYMYTPYLIIDNEMMTALCLAAKNGVDVRIITPGIPDKKIIFWLTRSYYAQLLDSGVRIFEYTPGFLHAKCFLSDDEVSIVGTINMDYRSLYLHFECGVFLYKTQAVLELKQDMLNTLKQSREITEQFVKSQNLGMHLIQSIMRVLAPLL